MDLSLSLGDAAELIAKMIANDLITVYREVGLFL